MDANEKSWRTPPPGTEIVHGGNAEKGDWFYIETLGAWGLVPPSAWGSPFGTRLVARGSVDMANIPVLPPTRGKA